MRVDYHSTKDLLINIFIAYGFTNEESKIIVDSLLAADLAGIESHGIQRMIRYDLAIGENMVDVNAVPEIVWETPISAVIDAKKAMGQLVSVQAMDLAIQKAKQSGMGLVAVRGSNHFGIAGYYARMASKQNLVGMAMTNSEPIMVPTHSRQAMLGTNPIALAFPAHPVDFCFDAATTVVPIGKLEVYRKAETNIPDGWGVDTAGTPCNDPAAIIRNVNTRAGGGILPVGGSNEQSGGHKGYGFGMMCELFTSVLSGGPPSYLTYQQSGVADTAHFFLAMNGNLFGSPEDLKASCSALLADLRNAAPATEGDRVYVHGEKEAEFAKGVLEQGIPANEKTVAELFAIAKRLQITPPDIVKPS